MLKTVYGAIGAFLALAWGTASAAIDPDRVNVLATVPVNSTGFFIDAGVSFSIDAEDETWGFCPFSFCVTDAMATQVVSGNIDTLTIGTETFGRGGLVGRIGTGDNFFIGESFTGIAQNAGELFLFMWDDSYGNNSGGIQVVLTGFESTPGDPVPLPAAAWLMMAGLGMLSTRRKRAPSVLS